MYVTPTSAHRVATLPLTGLLPGINPISTLYGWGNPLDGRGSYGPMRTPPPPPEWLGSQELGYVRHMNALANANPASIAFTESLAEKGGIEIWKNFARQYRFHAGFVRGWVGTGVLAATLGLTALRSQRVKKHWNRQRPYQVDGTIKTIGKLPHDASYPSGHTSSSYAAATVLSRLWPARAYEFNWWARQVGLSRVSSGVHFPSDVIMGAQLGRRTAAQVMNLF